MLGLSSLNLELLPLDPDLDRAFRKKHRTPVEWKSISEMVDNMAGNLNVNVEQLEQARVENMDHTRSLRDLFAPTSI
jgi:hypothetical protein